MSILAPIADSSQGAAVGDWRPTRYTRPLRDEASMVTDGDRLLTFADRYWSIEEAERFELDEWQR